MTRVQREAVKVLVRKSSARATWPRPSNTALQATCYSLNWSNTDRSNRFPPQFFKSKATGKGLPKPLPLLSRAHFLTPPVAVHPSHALFLFSCSPLPSAVRCNDARWSCPASFVCADDGRDAFGSSNSVASDGSIVDAVINIDPFEVAEMSDFGEFQSVTYAVDC